MPRHGVTLIDLAVLTFKIFKITFGSSVDADISTVKVILEFIKNFLLQVPIVTYRISSTEPQAFLQHHT